MTTGAAGVGAGAVGSAEVGAVGEPVPRLVNHLAVASVFTESVSLGYTPMGDLRLYYFFVFPLLAGLLVSLRGVYVGKGFLLGFSLLAAIGAAKIGTGDNQLLLLAKQAIGISLSATVFYMVLKANDGRVLPLFRLFLKYCVWVAAIGLGQEAAWLLRIKPLYDLNWLIGSAMSYEVAMSAGGFLLRIRSILPEPTFLACVLLPGVFASVAAWLNPGKSLLAPWERLVILAAFLLTFSSVGYLCAALSLVLFLINYRKLRYLAAAAVLAPAALLAAYHASPDVKLRVNGSLGYLDGTMEIEEMDLSNFALYSNLHVATQSFVSDPLFGSGLGSHYLSYEKHIGGFVDLLTTRKLFLNREDASSLGLRLLSETGLAGIALVLWFLLGNRLPMRQDPGGRLWVVNHGILLLFIARIIRFGNYFDLGCFLFFWMYRMSGPSALSGRPAGA